MEENKKKVLEMLIAAGKKIADLAERVASDELDLDSLGIVCYVAESKEDLEQPEPGAYPFACSNYTAGPEWILDHVLENALLDLMPEGGPLETMKWLADRTEGVIRKKSLKECQEKSGDQRSQSKGNVIPFPGGNQWKH